jgi:hypothetical protein
VTIWFVHDRGSDMRQSTEHRIGRRGVIVLAAMLVIVASCGGKGATSTATTTSTPTEHADRAGNWTVFVYMAADNNLEAAALDDLVQMTQAQNTDFIVLIDRAPGYSSADLFGLGDFTDAKLLHIRDGQPELLSSPGELNMGDPATLSSFIDVGLTSYRNDKNALVIWDHGGSWKGSAWDETSNNDNLTVAETQSAIQSGLAAAGVPKFDLVGFDACLMATYEVATSLVPYADVFVASEEVEPGQGWDWSALGTDPAGATDVQMADSILVGFQDESARNGETIVTLSAIDLRNMASLDAATADLAASMNDQARAVIGRVGYARNESLGFGKDPNPENDYFSVDLGSLASELEHVDGMESVATTLHDAVHDVVIRRVSGPVTADSSGVAAYFPPAQDLYSTKYDSAGFAPSWQSVLRSYYRTAANVPTSDLPTFTDNDRYLDDSNVITDAESVELVAKVAHGTGGNVIAGQIGWGELDPADSNIVWWIGEANASVSGDTVSGAYGWRQLVITDGVTSSVAFSSVNLNADKKINLIIIPIVFIRGTDSVNGTLQLSMDGENVLAETFFLSIGDGISAVTPLAGDQFVPLLHRENLTDLTDSWVPATTGTLSAEKASLSYKYSMVPTATPMLIGLGILDVAGNSDLVVHAGVSPTKTD